MYVAVKGGEKAIEESYLALARVRRGDPALPEISIDQIREQMPLAVARVMTEGSLYDRDLAALAIKQASGDLIEAIFLLRAYRTTLPRLLSTVPIDTAKMAIERRISGTFKDVPGGQILGATYDYTQRLLDFSLAAEATLQVSPQSTTTPPSCVDTVPEGAASMTATAAMPRVLDFLNAEGLIEQESIPAGDPAPGDLTRDPLEFPAQRDIRLQNLARADEGFVLSMAYSTQRGYANSHPFAGEIRHGKVSVEVVPEELGFAIEIGDIEITECQMVNKFAGSHTEPARFTRGYGLTFGYNERKVIAMGLMDRTLRCQELGEEASSPAQMAEFVLYHSDNVEASGFLQHLKLPHYVDFQAELNLIRALRRQTADVMDAAPAVTQNNHADDANANGARFDKAA
ncbi:carbon-phosphorus lyase complex subunit PhnI [Glaciimonas immobilis]|uniref:Alpha-D-ribose 1-methylphosphonate 5-triphosphate synthase subunit PhnI n=1 Tax=Glaciimonas immobilis TaxID=728004 RepID=A0A840RYD8_9BURK|nr:carbon-phosphorus lyase complex subunit PhnI [Glaciimonas immobilis]KAF3997203.1 carbon-phosphorus lyase complex subunit PhnI [Glaciimonas immobilis]MBB5202242.1 alpha-D-ribose 1-methylphosphonate 5-triphosphate synthase subunit PhnI [Glaciimonas immobilis]